MTAVAALDEGNTHFVGANVTLDESLALNIYAYIPDAVDPATVTMNFSYGGGAFAKTVAGVSTETANEYKFTYAGISPHHMGDAITTAMYVGGEEFATKEFLMTNYFNALLSMTYSELEMTKAQYKAMRTLIGDLCDYGAAAQTYKSYNTGDLVNEDFAEFASAAVDATLGTRSVTGSAVSGASFRGVSVYFDGENKLYIVINAEDETVANVTVKVTVGEGPQMTFGYSDFTKDSDGVYYFCTQSVKATEFASTITAVIYYGETEGQTLSYSVQSYVYAMQGGGDATAALVKALWKYGLSAVAFNEA